MTRLELEQMTAAIGKGLKTHVPPGFAYVFIMADFGPSILISRVITTTGEITLNSSMALARGGTESRAYLSNGQRADIIKMLREMAEKLEVA